MVQQHDMDAQSLYRGLEGSDITAVSGSNAVLRPSLGSGLELGFIQGRSGFFPATSVDPGGH